MSEIPAELTETFSILDEELSRNLIEALTPVADELGPRELAVLDRLSKGIVGGASPAELNAFVRLLPVTVSRAVQPVLDPVTAS